MLSPFLDLHLNRSSLYVYLIKYPEALADLKAAKALSPGKDFPEIDKIQGLNDKVFTLVASKANIKPKHLEELLAKSKDLVVCRDKLELRPTPFAQLPEGKLKGVCIAGRVVKIISEKESTVR